MTANVGGIDKILRISTGAIVILLGLIYSSWWGLVGVVLVATGFLNFCPVYTLFKFSSRKN